MVAQSGAATGYGVMILGMTATPLAMAHHHHDMADMAAGRGRAPAASGLTIFAVALVSSLLSGGLPQIIGRQMLNLILVPWMCLALLAIIGLGYHRKQTVPA